jgi:hypothetical protein
MTPITVTPVPFFDSFTRLAGRAAAALLPSLSLSGGAGLFWIGGGQSFVDAWTEADAYIVRLGRLELIVDRRAAAAA